MEQGKSSSYIARANGYHTLVDRVRNPTAMIGRRRGSDGDKVVIEGGETWRVGKQDKGGAGRGGLICLRTEGGPVDGVGDTWTTLISEGIFPAYLMPVGPIGPRRGLGGHSELRNFRGTLKFPCGSIGSNHRRGESSPLHLLWPPGKKGNDICCTVASNSNSCIAYFDMHEEMLRAL